ncbi:hypothetical protein LL240_17230 [Oceanimonas baumannii]|uniref:hypothetical protein n=1 Tax=Oceanimonas baumannii TaxID=129578 RepID=UPI001D17FE53|nr:hypothetical protein [Oceanimonas baumannii]MCC4266179.1 hypothetical protein [Oceanimonas baumannii]
MTTTEQILSHQLEIDAFHNSDPKCAGIARKAVDDGFDSLSAAQKAVLKPFLSKECVGYTDPGGYHNSCNIILEGEELLSAYKACDDSESLECESCRDELAFIEHQREKFFKD